MTLVVGIDFECPGGIISIDGFTQMSATIHDENRGTLIASFSMYARIDEYDWDERCVREFWSKSPERRAETIAKCKASVCTCEEVVAIFVQWVQENTAGHHAYMITDNAAYDAALLRYYAKVDVMYLFPTPNGEPMYRRIQDIHCFYRGVAAFSQREVVLDGTNIKGAKTAVLEALRLPTLPDWGVAHDPSNDCAKMVHDFCHIRNLLRN